MASAIPIMLAPTRRTPPDVRRAMTGPIVLPTNIPDANAPAANQVTLENRTNAAADTVVAAPTRTFFIAFALATCSSTVNNTIASVMIPAPAPKYPLYSDVPKTPPKSATRSERAPRDVLHDEMRGCAMRLNAAIINRNGTMRAKTVAGVESRRLAPAAPPAIATSTGRDNHRVLPRSSDREAKAEPGKIATQATMFVTLAVRGEMPTASNAGKDTSEVMPPADPIIPATTPAPTSAHASAIDIELMARRRAGHPSRTTSTTTSPSS